jgi:N-acetylglutamate synthase-like GNAT family acetyltransferase
MISNALQRDWEQIVDLVNEINLDRLDMDLPQFKVCKVENAVVGIGRIKTHTDCIELCTLGVREAFRGKGIGTALVRALLKGHDQAVYVVTEIPGFFEKLGFESGTFSLPSLQAKLKVCRDELACSQPEIMIRKPLI